MVDPREVPSANAEAERAAYLARRAERMKGRTLRRGLTRAEFRALLDGAEPATDDDVPWTFPVRTPVRRDAPS
ncbi:MAG: hypothetical protein ACR2MB_00485 [Acidimicrobiales bacterium]